MSLDGLVWFALSYSVLPYPALPSCPIVLFRSPLSLWSVDDNSSSNTHRCRLRRGQLQYSITYSWLYRLIAEISASAVIVHKPTPSPISISSIAFTSSSTTASVNCAVRRTAALGGYCCLRNPCSSGSDGDRSSSRATIASFQVRRREAARRAAAVAYGLPSLAGPTTSKAGNRSSLSTDGSSSNSSAI